MCSQMLYYRVVFKNTVWWALTTENMSIKIAWWKFNLVQGMHGKRGKVEHAWGGF